MSLIHSILFSLHFLPMLFISLFSLPCCPLTCTKIFGCKNNTHTVVYCKVFDLIFEISPYSHGQNAYRIEGHIATCI